MYITLIRSGMCLPANEKKKNFSVSHFMYEASSVEKERKKRKKNGGKILSIFAFCCMYVKM